MKKNFRMTVAFATMVLACGIAPSVFGVEGRIPIGNSPYLITNPGRYILTRNLPSAATPTIDINLPGGGDVDLDLNGFTVNGTLNHSLPAINVATSGGTNPRVRIHDGSIVEGAEAVYAIGPGSMVFEHLAVRNLNYGLYTSGAGNVVMRDCVIENVNTYGLFVSNAGGSGGATIERNAVRLAGRAIVVQHSATAAVLNNRVESGQPGSGSGILIQDATNCLVSENTVRDEPVGNGIQIDSMTGCKVFDNVVSGAGLNGIYVNGSSSRSLVWKNLVTGSGTGIRVEGNTNQIEGNVTNGNINCGLVISGSNNVYRGNTARGNSTAGSCPGACPGEAQVPGGNDTGGDNFVPGTPAACK